MKKIAYRVTFADSSYVDFTVTAQSINAGARKALATALRMCAEREFHAIEFREVKDFDLGRVVRVG